MPNSWLCTSELHYTCYMFPLYSNKETQLFTIGAHVLHTHTVGRTKVFRTRPLQHTHSTSSLSIPELHYRTTRKIVPCNNEKFSSRFLPKEGNCSVSNYSSVNLKDRL